MREKLTLYDLARMLQTHHVHVYYSKWTDGWSQIYIYRVEGTTKREKYNQSIGEGKKNQYMVTVGVRNQGVPELDKGKIF